MTLLLEHGDIPGFKVGRRRRRHEKRGGAWVRGHRVSGLVQRPSSGALRGFIAQRPLERSVRGDQSFRVVPAILQAYD